MSLYGTEMLKSQTSVEEGVIQDVIKKHKEKKIAKQAAKNAANNTTIDGEVAEPVVAAKESKIYMTEAEAEKLSEIVKNIKVVKENSVEKAIMDLKNKSTVTDADIKSLCSSLSKSEDKAHATKVLVGLITLYVSTITAGISSAIALEDKDNKVANAIAILSSATFITTAFNLLSKTNVDSFYSKIIKMEAKANVKIKIATDEDEKKELQKIIDLCESLKKKRKQYVYNIERNKDGDDDSEDEEKTSTDESALLEFAGDPVKVDALKQAISDMDEVFNAQTELFKNIDDTIEQIESIEENITKKNINESIVKIHQIGRATNESYLKPFKGIPVKHAYNVLTNELKSFTNKYSFDSMKEKTAINNKIKKIDKLMEDYYKKYSKDGEFYKRDLAAYDKVTAIDFNAAKEISAVEMSWITAMFTELAYTTSDLSFLKSVLKIEKTQKSMIYKLLNAKEIKAAKKEIADKYKEESKEDKEEDEVKSESFIEFISRK